MNVPAPKVMRPPGLESEYGTPQGSSSDLLGLDAMPITITEQPEPAWELDLDGLNEKDINLRILK